ncbi:MAG: DUF4416 domain-containing protein [Chlamydiae bacterium]|nr:MAG: DUF4416 domain-containing protein [Chlamydiota bacterium]
MSIPNEPESGILLCGIMRQPEISRETIISRLENAFGPVAARSDEFPFSFTNYYEPEMGENILRSFLTFKKHISPDAQAETKLKTNEIESEFIKEGKRRVNLDPGLLTAHNLILTTGKDFSHRIYLQNGIFAEVTLMVNKGKLAPLPWTYADYRSDIVLDFFEKERQKFLTYRKQRK